MVVIACHLVLSSLFIDSSYLPGECERSRGLGWKEFVISLTLGAQQADTVQVC